jgi:hypothetical protein
VQRIVAELLVEEGIDSQVPHRADHDRVAVRAATGGELGGQRAVRPGAVVIRSPPGLPTPRAWRTRCGRHRPMPPPGACEAMSLMALRVGGLLRGDRRGPRPANAMNESGSAETRRFLGIAR